MRAPAAASGPVTVTIAAPAAAEAFTSVTVSGSVRLQGLPLPSQSVTILVDGVEAATATTDTGGTYSAGVSFVPGAHSVEAVVLAGLPSLESKSDSVTVWAGRFPLTVVLAGSGAGSVSSSNGGIACPGDCSDGLLKNESVTLTASPSAGSAFDGWSGACSGASTTCSLSGTGAPLNVTATFRDIVPPVAPAITGIAPGSPANNNAPVLSGTSEAGTTVKIFSQNNCAGSFVAGVTNVQFAGGVTVSVADNTTTSFSAHATDGAGNVSDCSAAVTYVEDSTAPETTIASAPPLFSNSSSATFTFTASETAAFACALDGGAFSACVTPVSYGGLPDGSHTFAVRATDAAGNVDATPASHTWILDTLPPTVTITSAPASPTNQTTASFAFSSEAGASFQCSLNGGAYASCASPKSYSGLPAGTHQFRVRAVDPAGNTGDPTAHSWVIDLDAPVANITSGPPTPTNTTSATFHFNAEPGATYQCALDAGAFASCTSPATYASLAEGTHTFNVKASDAAGNTGPAATHSWTIDITPPDTTITSGPSGTTTDNSATFGVGASESATFACAFDGGAWSACTNPASYSGLADGAHTFQVRATDLAGNVDPSPASRAWTIDTTPPAVSITSAPASPTNATGATFVFSSEPDATFECSLNGVAYASCSSPRSYTGFADGTHTFRVRPTDDAGNVGAPADHTWTIDTVAPTTTITAGPSATTSSTGATFEFSTEQGATLACELDGGGFSSCASPKSYAGLADATHTFKVRATDAAGNIGGAASHTWTVDTIPPESTITAGPSGIVASASASLSFTANETSTFECMLDGGAWQSCDSPKTYAGLPDGAHTFGVRATDQAGNAEATAATRAWTIDTSGPATTIASGPGSPTNATGASMTFSTEAGATTACSLDAAAYAPCTSPKSYSDLSDGDHTFLVRATDAAGNVGPAAAHGWTIDTVVPSATITSGPTGVTADTTASFTFSASEPSTFACSIDGSAFVACVNPATYAALSDGAHTFSVRATDQAGNTGVAVSQTWTVDTLAPDTSITAGPSGTVASGSATFSFTATETAAFACSLDAGAYSPCVSPVSFNALGNGSHTLLVRATDQAGNTDATPASRTWTVDITSSGGPSVTITAAPANPSTSSSASFSFTAPGGTTLKCSLDGSAQATCTSPKSYSGLTDGTHQFSVVGTDGSGNTGPVSSHAWTIDTVAPVAQITSSPASPTNATSASLSFTSEPGVTFECSLNGSAFAACTSPRSYSSLADATHTFRVRAIDQAGNVDPSPDEASWIVDTVASAPTISLLGSSPANDNSPILAGAAESGATVRVYRTGDCSGTPFAVVGAADYLAGVTAGVDDDTSTSFSARITDAAGNLSGCSGAIGYVEDSTPPSFAGLIYAQASARGRLTVSWTEATDAISAGPALTYQACLSTTAGSCLTGFAPALSRDGNTRLAFVDGLDDRQRYYVVVGATDEAGNRGLSIQINALTLAPVPQQIVAGDLHTCALLSNATVKCWGRNSEGQIGDGTTTQRLTPTSVTGLTGATAITAGDSHTCALLSDTTVKCWGNNVVGQIGDGTTTNRTTPTTVTGLTGATAITAGDFHTCALLSDATVKCWGPNRSGQIGDGTTTNRTTPTTVTGLTGA
ncbi:MAG TPA: hypothetical protein VGB64_09200, partial [Actinomycetota bacterium]